MCLHTHTIVHRHLYNIKGVIYKSTGIIHSAGPAGVPLQDFPTRVEPARGRGTRGGCPPLHLLSGRTPRGRSLLESGAQSPRYALCPSLIGKLV